MKFEYKRGVHDEMGKCERKWIDRLIWSIFVKVVWNFESNRTTLNIVHKMWKKKYKSECDKNECTAKLHKGGLNDRRNILWNFYYQMTNIFAWHQGWMWLVESCTSK